MSRLGKTPIAIPKGVEVKTSKEGKVHVVGPKGTLEMQLPKGIHLKIEGTVVSVERDEALVPEKAMHGLYRALLNNLLVGVSTGFEVKLTMIGVGYRANVQGNILDLQVGYSHPTTLVIPKGVQVTVDKGTMISIKGIDKQLVGQFAAETRAVRSPEPYKGKGIRYEDEFVRKKEGKAAKGKA